MTSVRTGLRTGLLGVLGLLLYTVVCVGLGFAIGSCTCQ